jgi:hypothetical protein
MRAIERRIAKIEGASGRPGDVRAMSDQQLKARICQSMTDYCRAGKTFEEIVASYRAEGFDDIADMVAGCYFWDATSRTVKEKSEAECDRWTTEYLRREQSLACADQRH